MQTNFKCVDYNPSTRMTAYAECIYVFYHNLVLIAEYHVDR